MKETVMSTSSFQRRPAAERGAADHGWLQTRHSFSFAGYYDPRHMGFRSLRVINDDRVQPGQGFGTHPHRDMEIVTVVVEGALEHRDSMGNGSVIRPGEVQRMTAGTGVTHSEFNPSAHDELRLLQIWIEPERVGLEPGYEQRAFPFEEHRNRWTLIASRSGRSGSLTIHQDAEIHRSSIDGGHELELEVAPDRHLWIQVIAGEVEANGHVLSEGDGASLSGVELLSLTGLSPSSDVLLFDLA
jgi:redox-sensitive bicupin YhaK (pirin superfamily)